MSASAFPVPELCARFGRLYTGAVTDVLDQLGHRSQTLPHTILPLRPGMRTAGIAYPVLGRPRSGHDHDRALRAFLRMLGEAPRDSVLVCQSNDDTAAHLGELSVIALRARGCRGAVMDGSTRDVEYILREDFPVFVRYRTPVDSVPRWEVVDWNCRIVVGDVVVNPGDFVMADADGIVIVPMALAGEVLARCEEVVAAEDKVREAVRAGVSPLEAYDRFGKF